MSEKSGVFSQENLSTIVAVTFVLALVSLAFNFFTFSRLNEVAVVAGAVDVGVNAKHTQSIDELRTKIAALEGEVAAAKKAAADAKKAAAAAPE